VRPGALYIVYGGKNLPGSRDFAVEPDSPGHDYDPKLVTCLLGKEDKDQAGFSVASGDVDGDGIDDVIAGAPKATPDPQWPEAGEVYILYGRQGLDGTPPLKMAELGNDQSGTRILGRRPPPHLGCSVACGDVNGDGKADVIVGADQTNNGAGELNIFYGSKKLRGKLINLAADSPSVHVSAQDVTEPAKLGLSMAWKAADLNRDGYADVVSLWMQKRPGNGPGAGEIPGGALVLFGGGESRYCVVRWAERLWSLIAPKHQQAPVRSQ